MLKRANTELYRVRFQVKEECMPDSDSERGRDEWLFILSKEIRDVVDKHLPELINLAKNELPK